MEAASSHFKSFERNPATDIVLSNVSMRSNLCVNAMEHREWMAETPINTEFSYFEYNILDAPLELVCRWGMSRPFRFTDPPRGRVSVPLNLSIRTLWPLPRKEDDSTGNLVQRKKRH